MRSCFRRSAGSRSSLRHRAAECKKFLSKIDKEVPEEFQVHLILDTYASHRTPSIKQWLPKFAFRAKTEASVPPDTRTERSGSEPS